MPNDSRFGGKAAAYFANGETGRDKLMGIALIFDLLVSNHIQYKVKIFLRHMG